MVDVSHRILWLTFVKLFCKVWVWRDRGKASFAVADGVVGFTLRGFIITLCARVSGCDVDVGEMSTSSVYVCKNGGM